MELGAVVDKLRSFAPHSLSESWDNVGLLVEPSAPHAVSSMMLTNDLTEPVLEEAIQGGANMILSYHPPIFAPLLRLTQDAWKERLIVRGLENKLAIYSPHTAYDSMKGGVNDWLISCFECSSVDPVIIAQSDRPLTIGQYRVDTRIPSNYVHQFMSEIKDLSSESVEITDTASFNSSGPDLKLRLCCSLTALPKVLKSLEKHSGAMINTEIIELAKPPLVGQGQGRLGQLTSPVKLTQVVETVKAHLGLKHIRLARCQRHNKDSSTVGSVAVCAGSGGSVLQGVRSDVYVTGEMSHHAVLDAVASGTSVILCEHSNTERGYLRVLREKLHALLDNRVNVWVSERDCDPLVVC